MNAFETFSLKPTLDLDLEALRKVYQDIAAQNHPDSGGDQVAFERVNAHYNELKSPSRRLKAFMDAKGLEHDPRGAVSNDLMDLFMLVGSLLQNTDSFLRKKSQATSILAKALLEAESMETQDQLSKLIASVEEKIETLTGSFSKDLQTMDLPALARNLSFLEKWQAQLQQRYGSLF